VYYPWGDCRGDIDGGGGILSIGLSFKGDNASLISIYKYMGPSMIVMSIDICTYICAYIYTCVHPYINICAYSHTYINTCIHTYI
jgi:hypothetical protein